MSSSDSVEMTVEEENNLILPLQKVSIAPKRLLKSVKKDDRIDKPLAQVENISSFIQEFMATKSYFLIMSYSHDILYLKQFFFRVNLTLFIYSYISNEGQNLI